MSQLYSNNASSLLISDLLVADTTITLAPGEGDQFPLPDAGDDESFSMLTLEDVGGNIEIVKMTERSGDILTIVRGEEATVPSGFATGSRVEARLTAGSLDNFKQVADQFELRGGVIDSDGLRLWHQQDPSSYQFFTLRYYTYDALGVPWLHFEAPPGITGLSLWNSVTAADGASRGMGLVQDYGNAAPYPGTGQVALQNPGILSWSTINDAIFSPLLYASFEFDVPTDTFKLQFAANRTGGVSYEFRCRDEFGVNHPVLFNKDGSVTASRLVQIANGSEGVYPDADPINIMALPGILDAGTTDYLYFQGDAHDSRVRELGHWFSTRYQVEGSDPVTYASAQVVIQPGGTVYAEEPPVEDQHLTNKLYVDAEVASTADYTTGAGLNSIAADLYGRTLLWNNDSGDNSGTTQTLLNSLQWDDFYQIEVTGDVGDDGWVSFSIDTETYLDKGYNTKWEVCSADGTGGDVRKLYIIPESLTEFRVSNANSGSGKVVRVIGKFPKNPGGV